MTVTVPVVVRETLISRKANMRQPFSVTAKEWRPTPSTSCCMPTEPWPTSSCRGERRVLAWGGFYFFGIVCWRCAVCPGTRRQRRTAAGPYLWTTPIPRLLHVGAQHEWLWGNYRRPNKVLFKQRCPPKANCCMLKKSVYLNDVAAFRIECVS